MCLQGGLTSGAIFTVAPAEGWASFPAVEMPSLPSGTPHLGPSPTDSEMRGQSSPVMCPSGLPWPEGQDAGEVRLCQGLAGTLPGDTGVLLGTPLDTSPEGRKARCRRSGGPGTPAGAGGELARRRPELRGCPLSPPPSVLGFWAEVSWLIWVPISGHLSCHWLLKNNQPLGSGHTSPHLRLPTGVGPWPGRGGASRARPRAPMEPPILESGPWRAGVLGTGPTGRDGAREQGETPAVHEAGGCSRRGHRALFQGRATRFPGLGWGEQRAVG